MTLITAVRGYTCLKGKPKTPCFQTFVVSIELRGKQRWKINRHKKLFRNSEKYIFNSFDKGLSYKKRQQ